MIIVPTLNCLLGFALGQEFSGYPKNRTLISIYMQSKSPFWVWFLSPSVVPLSCQLDFPKAMSNLLYASTNLL